MTFANKHCQILLYAIFNSTILCDNPLPQYMLFYHTSFFSTINNGEYKSSKSRHFGDCGSRANFNYPSGMQRKQYSQNQINLIWHFFVLKVAFLVWSWACIATPLMMSTLFVSILKCFDADNSTVKTKWKISARHRIYLIRRC